MRISEILEPPVEEINASVEGKKIRRPSKTEKIIDQLDREEARSMGLPVSDVD